MGREQQKLEIKLEGGLGHWMEGEDAPFKGQILYIFYIKCEGGYQCKKNLFKTILHLNFSILLYIHS